MVTGNHGQSEQIKIYHEGKCARCGRPLTVPESIESGFGGFMFTAKRNWAPFIEMFNNELSAMKADGRLDAIVQKYQ
jgi:hypothetical protein